MLLIILSLGIKELKKLIILDNNLITFTKKMRKYKD